MAKRAAATGSVANIMAVSEGLRIFCAHIIIKNARKVARKPVIMMAPNKRSDQIIGFGSNIRAWNKDTTVTKASWILKKGKEYVTIEKNKQERGKFYLQKDEDRRLSLTALQARLTYHQLIEFGYKLRK